jgi:hypothetical protein
MAQNSHYSQASPWQLLGQDRPRQPATVAAEIGPHTVVLLQDFGALQQEQRSAQSGSLAGWSSASRSLLISRPFGRPE